MVEEVAEVVAVVRAESGDYEREMRKADATTRRVQKMNESSDRASVDGANRTAAALGRVRLGWLGVAGAMGVAINLLTRGPLGQARAQQRSATLDIIGDQLARGLGFDDLNKATNRKLLDIARGLRRTREADPSGSIVGGLLAQRVERIQQQTDFERGLAEGQAGGFGNKVGQFGLGVAGIPLSLAGAAAGQTESAMGSLDRSRGRISGALGFGQPALPSTQRLLERAGGGTARIEVDMTLRADQMLQNVVNDPEVQRILRQALEYEMRQNATGGMSG